MKRCFIAIKIPYEIQVVKLLELLKKDLSSSRVNWVTPGNMHLTLAFLGEIRDERINLTIDILNALRFSFTEIEIELKGFGTFGSTESPNVVWLGIKSSPILNELKIKLDEGLKITGYEADRRGFQPHLTLGRIKSFNNYTRLAAIYRQYRTASFLNFMTDHICMYESRLSEKGSEYILIRKFQFQT